MAKTTFSQHKPISVSETIEALVGEEIITSENAIKIVQGSALAKNRKHAFEFIADQYLRHPHDDLQAIDTDWLCHWLSGKLSIPLIDVSGLQEIPPIAIERIGRSYLQKRQVLPVAADSTSIQIATAEPFLASTWIGEVAQVTRLTVRYCLANPSELRRALPRLLAMSSVGLSVDNDSAHSDDQSTQTIASGSIDLFVEASEDPPVGNTVALVNWILLTALERKASDIHLEPHTGTGYIRMRFDGSLHSIARIPAVALQESISRLKVKANLDISERRKPQDGRLRVTPLDGDEIELRLSTVPIAGGEKLVARIFRPEILHFSLDELGFTSRDREIWMHIIRHTHGIVLVTGPTGSGKTTTLYSALKAIAREEINISTIEDPIELIDRRFCQLQVDSAIGLTFGVGARALLRQDPDVIMIGEIRDSESATVAVQAALTGHLVFSTMHTNDAPSAVVRFLDLGIAPYLLKATIVGIVAQRLVRKLCPACRKSEVLSPADWQFLTNPLRMARPSTMYTARGCSACHGIGYKGRTGIYEMLIMAEQMRRIISPSTDVVALRKLALQSGMLPLRASGAEKIGAGVTSVDEVLRVVPPHFEI